MKIAKVIAESWCYDDMEKEGLEALIAEKLGPIMEVLLSAKMCLPDSAGYDESWEWAWNELSCESQSQVKAIRAEIEAALAMLSNDE